MAALDPALLKHRNVAAFLRVIRTGEGTADAGGYSRLFGGAPFAGFADHPRVKVCKTYSGRQLCSTAAGAYQFLATTWDETARIMRLRDFSPASQDLAALGRIAARGALDDVLAGRFEAALKRVAYEWASMPGSPYGQPVITLARAGSVYQSNGGTLA
jgi:muramidase (phage lysozyme)